MPKRKSLLEETLTQAGATKEVVLVDTGLKTISWEAPLIGQLLQVTLTLVAPIGKIPTSLEAQTITIETGSRADANVVVAKVVVAILKLVKKFNDER